MLRKKEVTLQQALEMLIDNLVQKGVLNEGVDRAQLLNDTLNNLEKTWGKDNLPRGEQLKNPLMLMKLTMAVVATHKLPAPKAQALIKNLQKVDNALQLQRACDELTKAFTDPNELKNFLQLMQILLKDAKKRLTANPPTPDQQQDNTYMAEYSADGTCINVLEGVFGKTKAEQVFTIEEEAAMGAPELIERLDQIEARNALSPHPPGA
jgi:hypothetical protein